MTRKDDVEGELRSFHTRSFPGGAFLPGSLRAINPRRTDVAILNALIGVRPKERSPREVLSDLVENGFVGDQVSRDRFRGFVEKVWFPPNRGKMGNEGQEVLISHIKLGAAFRPKHHYGADKWAIAILRTGDVLDDPECTDLMKELLEKAQSRAPNLVEKALLDTLGEAPQGGNGETGPLLPLVALNRNLGEMIRNLLRQAQWPGTNNDDAERILLDVVALLRTGTYLNWILMNEQAYRAITSFRQNLPFDTTTPRLHFGMSKEKRTGTGRSFHRTQTQLESNLEEGNFAIMALSQLHALAGWTEARWFDHLAGPEGDEKAPAGAGEWFEEYSDAMSAQGVGGPYQPEDTPTTMRETLCEMHLAISRNSKKWRPKPNTRFSNRSTLGALTSMALAEGGALFAPGTGRRKHLPMLDTDLFLLVGRAMMNPNERTAAKIQILQGLENLGIRLDDTSVAMVDAELERTGRIRRLSDAGESLYVRVD